LIDPIGLGFEQYNAIGVFQPKMSLQFGSRGDESKGRRPTTIELDLDTAGYIQGIEDSAFSNPKELGKLVAKTKALFVVDGISGVGAAECRTDEWKVDLLAVGAQKALMLPPGLAYLAVSAKAKAVETGKKGTSLIVETADCDVESLPSLGISCWLLGPKGTPAELHRIRPISPSSRKRARRRRPRALGDGSARELRGSREPLSRRRHPAREPDRFRVDGTRDERIQALSRRSGSVYNQSK
jgi:hypothetical protein